MKGVQIGLIALLGFLAVVIDHISYTLSVLIDGVLIGLIIAIVIWWPEKATE